MNSDLINFKPLLPFEKYEAFDGITLGSYTFYSFAVLKKIFINSLIFKKMNIFSKINSLSSFPCCFDAKLHNGNLSYFDVGGNFALELEKEGEKASIDFVLNILRSSFGNTIDKYLMNAHVTFVGK